jgi:hypothetical protein
MRNASCSVVRFVLLMLGVILQRCHAVIYVFYEIQRSSADIGREGGVSPVSQGSRRPGIPTGGYGHLIHTPQQGPKGGPGTAPRHSSGTAPGARAGCRAPGPGAHPRRYRNRA